MRIIATLRESILILLSLPAMAKTTSKIVSAANAFLATLDQQQKDDRAHGRRRTRAIMSATTSGFAGATSQLSSGSSSRL